MCVFVTILLASTENQFAKIAQGALAVRRRLTQLHRRVNASAASALAREATEAWRCCRLHSSDCMCVVLYVCDDAHTLIGSFQCRREGDFKI